MTTAVRTDYFHPEAIRGDALLAYARNVLAEIIEQLPADLVAKRGLRSYTIHLNARLTSTYGYCRYGQRRIEIADRLAEINPLEQTDDTIRHEIAHAIAGYGGSDSRVHHGPHWQAACTLTGADPTRCHSAKTPRRWVGECSACGEIVTPYGGGYKSRSQVEGWAHGSDCPAFDTHERKARRLSAIDLRAVALRAAKAAHSPKDSPMAPRYTIRITSTLDGARIVNTVERARKDDALALAERHEALDAVVVVRTPGGSIIHTTDGAEVLPGDDPADEGQPLVAIQTDANYRAPRIPAGAIEHRCDECGRMQPITKYPTTRDGSRKTECRECRDARYAASA